MSNISVSALNQPVYEKSEQYSKDFSESINTDTERIGCSFDYSVIDKSKAEYDKTCDLYLHCDNPQKLKEYEEEMDKAYLKWQIAKKNLENSDNNEISNNTQKRTGIFGDFIKNSGKKIIDFLVKYVI